MGYMRSSCGERAVSLRHLHNLGTTEHVSDHRLEQSQRSTPRGGMSRGSGSSSVIAITTEVRDGEGGANLVSRRRWRSGGTGWDWGRIGAWGTSLVADALPISASSQLMTSFVLLSTTLKFIN